MDNHNKTIGDITGVFKSLCVHHILKKQKEVNYDIIIGKIWQRNLWEHIIRSAAEWEMINQYILNNPKNWDKDSLNTPPS